MQIIFQLHFLSHLLCYQRNLFLWAAQVRAAAVWVGNARASGPHLDLQPHHHPRPV